MLCSTRRLLRMNLEDSMQRSKNGSVVQDKRSRVWNFYWWEDGKRRSKVLGKFSTKTAAWNAAQQFNQKAQPGPIAPTVDSLVEAYRTEKMPQRYSTRRG